MTMCCSLTEVPRLAVVTEEGEEETTLAGMDDHHYDQRTTRPYRSNSLSPLRPQDYRRNYQRFRMSPSPPRSPPLGVSSCRECEKHLRRSLADLSVRSAHRKTSQESRSLSEEPTEDATDNHLLRPNSYSVSTAVC